MQYEPIKRSLDRFLSGQVIARKFYYLLLDLILLRTWHVKKALRNAGRLLPGEADILDAGSGPGQYSWRMCRMNRQWNITGVDIDNENIEACRRFFDKTGLGRRTRFICADLASFSDPGKFSLILSVDVMEHIKDDIKVFRNFNESLKKGGILIVSTPSDKGGSGTHSDEDESFIDEHVRNGYGAEEIREKLSGAGFTGIEVKYTYGPAGNISWHLTMKYPVKMLNVSNIFFFILPFYYLLALPAAMILNIIDLKSKHKKGTGLLVTAMK